ncbi:hypothetical protein [Defluviimonas salinarum]|uniref:Uncharacterized protein n=1 Tax=Defluviimonas salinarum TaxID=2992147 RepID=A0ABT3J881_9RHOB|nr:hypothetical protein [Defluviimonas salinarum]MCW3783897.1 hypothetical protein [Defluviimonas salinarum]
MTADPSRALILAIPGRAGQDILPGSAIVCAADADRNPVVDTHGRVTAWFEGNAYDAVNLRDFIDRTRCAAGRMVQDYPTVAVRSVPAAEIRILADFDLERGIVTRIRDEHALAEQSGEDPARLVAPRDMRATTDREKIRAAMEIPGGRMAARDPIAWQAGDGRVILAGSDGAGTRMYHPADRDLPEVIGGLDEADLRRILGSDHRRNIEEHMLDVLGAPLLVTASGSWHEIRDSAQAEIAETLSRTAVAMFWENQRRRFPEDMPHRWMILAGRNLKGRLTAPALFAAMPEGSGMQIEATGLGTDCHVTGHQNRNAWPEYGAEIEAIARQEGLVMRPNHMGREIAEPEEGPSPS